MRRFALALGTAALALAFVAAPAWADNPTNKTVLIQTHTVSYTNPADCGSLARCDFSYKNVPHQDPLISTFYVPGFDFSAWLAGPTPFMGRQVDYFGCPELGLDQHGTLWPVNEDALLLIPIPLCLGVTGVEIHFAIDNSVRVWWNGVQLTDPYCPYDHSPEGLCDWEYCTSYDRAKYTVPDSALAVGSNVLAIQACDHGQLAFLDFQVLGDTSAQVCDDPCEHVTVSGELWPPNHKFKTVSVLVGGGATPTVATITSVKQDEPTRAPGDKCPDASIATDGLSAALRVERLGTGDGRVYHLGYDATVNGVRCTETITVCVPHDQGTDFHDNCVDGGPLYDSTVCN